MNFRLEYVVCVTSSGFWERIDSTSYRSSTTSEQKTGFRS